MKREAVFRAVALLASAAVLSAYGSASASTITPTRVLGGKLNQYYPAANDSNLIWTQNSTRHPTHYDAVDGSLPPLGVPTKMNSRRSFGFSGDITPGTSEAIYQEVANNASDLYLYDVSAHVRTDPPAGVNTSGWEWSPSVSAGFIEFGRGSQFYKPNAPSKVMLYDRTNHTTMKLASVPQGCQCILASQVSDEYATWFECVRTCHVWYYDIIAGQTHRVKAPHGLDQYAPSVDGATGTLYFARSGHACGRNVKIVRWTIGSPISTATVVTALPRGDDLSTTSVTIAGANDDVYLDQFRCSRRYSSDIYVVTAADTATSSVRYVGRAPSTAVDSGEQRSRIPALPGSYPAP